MEKPPKAPSGAQRRKQGATTNPERAREGLARARWKDAEGLLVQHRALIEAYVGEANFDLLKACDLAEIAPGAPRHKRLKKAERIMAQPEVRAFMQAWIESDPLVMSRQERLRILTGIGRGTITEKRYGKDGESWDAPPTLDQRMKALDLLGKAQGDALNVNLTISPEQMSEDELVAAMLALGVDLAQLGEPAIDTQGEDVSELPTRDSFEADTLLGDDEDLALPDVESDP